MTVMVVLLAVAAIVGLWVTFSIIGLTFALLPWAIMGFLTGWVASRLTRIRLGTGWTILAGIAGSWLGGAIFGGLLRIPVGGIFDPRHLVAALVGSVLVITAARLVMRPALPDSSPPRLSRTY